MKNDSIPRHQRPTKLRTFLFGCPYYPEHWTVEDRRDDPQRMAAAGMNVVRMAEFAWDRIEPARGQLDFSLFDETIERLGKVGVSTILCTPTATPPRRMTVDHEDWMRVDENGRRMDHGSRQHCCTNNEEFRAESRRITQAMAEHYGANPHVIGWQTDNEFYCHFSQCHCPSCRRGFREWLRRKYGTIARLNAAWGCAFWALTFDDFDQVPLPYPNSNRPTHPNPTHELDYYRYLSDSLIEFQRQQVQILRAANPNWFITHNGMFGHIDYWKFTEDLDFLGVDVYPGFLRNMPADAVHTALWNERCRAASGGYIVPEQQGGPGGQRPYVHRTPAPGQMRLWAYQSIAHGADGVLHFRWRTCRFGAETYWHGILDHDNVPRRRYEEFSREGAELKRIGGKILGTVLDVQAAVLVETEQDDAHTTLNLHLPSPSNQRDLAFSEMWRRHLPCGLVQTADGLAGLRLLVVPSMPLMDDGLAGKLRAFVEGGGLLIVTARTAIRDRDNQATPMTPPIFLSDLCGVSVEEFGKCPAGEASFRLGGVEVPCGEGYEMLGLRGAESVGIWHAPKDAGPFAPAGQPAVSIRRVGDGEVIYLGTYLSPGNVGAVFDLALHYAGIPSLADAAELVEVTRRVKGGGGARPNSGVVPAYTFVLNHYATQQEVRNLPEGADLLSGARCDGKLELEPYGVAIVEEG